MSTEIHFVDVGQGNMVLIKADDGSGFVFDCNITQDNEKRVLGYVQKVFGKGNPIGAFICSHRDADHMRGIKKLHNQNPICEIWDSDYPGTTTDTMEYKEYMNLCYELGASVIPRYLSCDFEKTRLCFMSSADERLPENANAQGIVLKVEQRSRDGSRCLSSVMLPGDSDAETWKFGILKDYNLVDVQSSILMAAHHGSNSFFYISNDGCPYTGHLQAIKPDIVIVSVGRNPHGHPDKKALGLYERYAKGAKSGRKIFQTDEEKTMKLTLKTNGSWNLNFNQ